MRICTKPSQSETGTSPARNIELLAKAETRYDIRPHDVAQACGVDEEAVDKWRRTGLFGPRSVRAIRRLIEESERRHARLVAKFVETYRSAGFERVRDLRLAGIDEIWVEWPDGRTLLNSKCCRIDERRLHPRHLERLRSYVAWRDRVLESERRREARHFERRYHQTVRGLVG